MSPTRVYKGERISVEWWADRCVKCGNCHESLPAVFNPEARPWVKIDGAAPAEIRRVCEACPSEAIVAVQP